MTLQLCGTNAAYQRHVKNGEEADAACLVAHTEHHQRWRERSPGSRKKSRKVVAARGRALTRLKHMHPGEYRALYTEEIDR